MKRILIGATAVLTLGACTQAPHDEAATASPPQSKHSGLILANMDTSVAPGDDFHAYVNGTWIATTEIPADKPSYGIGTILHERSQEQVKEIIEESANGDFAAGSDEQKVGDLYASFLDVENRDALGIEPLAPEFAKIAKIPNHDELAIYFAEANKIGIAMPFSLGQYVDFKDPNAYMIHTWQGGLGLPDREYYFLDDEKSVDIRAKYLAHIEKMFELAGLPDGKAAAKAIVQLETKMAAEHMKKEDTRDMVALYNSFPTEELPSLMPNFNWDGYLQAAGVSELPAIVVTQLDHMKGLDPIIQGTDLETWKTWLHWTVLNSNANRLTSALSDQDFDFYQRTLRGVEEPQPMWRRGVNVVNGTLGEVVGKVYVARHFPPQAKEKMLELVGNLTKAYEISIRELDWMGEETKAQALDKLSKFTPKVGYPDEWRDYSKLIIDAKDLVGNLQRAALVDYERNLERQGGAVDRGEWSMTPQTVNAYYNPPLNEIVFPAAILQPPFFDLSADDAVNYGAIGAIIGHEIGHGFDDSGSTFDGDGVLRNWWTDEDKSEFEARTAKLIAQYDAFAPFEDLHVNGEYTLGENIGDLGGLSIGLLAYEISLDGAEAPVMDGFTGQQRVFLGYGQAWLKKAREEALRHQIGTDPHSPAKYRTNGVVRNVPGFYEAFEIAETDELYLPPEDRVKIW